VIVPLRQFAPKPRLDESERSVVASAIRPKHLLVPFGDHRETTALGGVDRSLEIHGTPLRDYQPIARYGPPVDRYVSDRPERSVVAKSEPVYLAGSSQNMSRLELTYSVSVDRNDLDTEVSDSHAALRYEFLSSLVVVPQ